MKTRYFLIFLLLTLCLLLFLLKAPFLKETLTSANPVGTCQTKDGSFGTQTQFTLDNGSSTTICQANNLLLSSPPSSAPSSSAPSSSAPSSSAPSSSAPSSSAPSAPSSDPIAPKMTPFSSLSSDFDYLCRQQFGPDYGYQLLSFNSDNTQQQATCSQAYQGGLPLYENKSTDCVPFPWSGPITDKDDRKEFMKLYCNTYSFDLPLKNISSRGCSAPNQARAICS